MSGCGRGGACGALPLLQGCLKLLMWPWWPRACSVHTSIHAYIFLVQVLSHFLSHACADTHLHLYPYTCTYNAHSLLHTYLHACSYSCCHTGLLMYTPTRLYPPPHTCTFTHSIHTHSWTQVYSHAVHTRVLTYCMLAYVFAQFTHAHTLPHPVRCLGCTWQR